MFYLASSFALFAEGTEILKFLFYYYIKQRPCINKFSTCSTFTNAKGNQKKARCVVNTINYWGKGGAVLKQLSGILQLSKHEVKRILNERVYI